MFEGEMALIKSPEFGAALEFCRSYKDGELVYPLMTMPLLGSDGYLYGSEGVSAIRIKVPEDLKLCSLNEKACGFHSKLIHELEGVPKDLKFRQAIPAKGLDKESLDAIDDLLSNMWLVTIEQECYEARLVQRLFHLKNLSFEVSSPKHRRKRGTVRSFRFDGGSGVIGSLF